MREEAVAVMREVGVDISAHRPKPIDAAMALDVRLVIGLCAEEACPVIPGVRSVHWPLSDPAGRPLAAYRAVRHELSRRIRDLIGELREEA